MSRDEVSFAAKVVERWAADEVPQRLQNQIRIEVETKGSTITIWECRPPWKPEYGTEWTKHGVARFKYSPTTRLWSLYWMCRDLKFHLYELIDPQERIGPLLEEVKVDPHACFWG